MDKDKSSLDSFQDGGRRENPMQRSVWLSVLRRARTRWSRLSQFGAWVLEQRDEDPDWFFLVCTLAISAVVLYAIWIHLIIEALKR